MFRSPPKATLFLETHEAVAMSIFVSPEAGIITSLALLKTRSLIGILVFEYTSLMTSLYLV